MQRRRRNCAWVARRWMVRRPDPCEPCDPTPPAALPCSGPCSSCSWCSRRPRTPRSPSRWTNRSRSSVRRSRSPPAGPRNAGTTRRRTSTPSRSTGQPRRPRPTRSCRPPSPRPASTPSPPTVHARAAVTRTRDRITVQITRFQRQHRGVARSPVHERDLHPRRHADRWVRERFHLRLGPRRRRAVRRQHLPHPDDPVHHRRAPRGQGAHHRQRDEAAPDHGHAHAEPRPPPGRRARPPPPPPCTKRLAFGLSEFTTDGCFSNTASKRWETTAAVKLNGVSFPDYGQTFVITEPTASEPGGHFKAPNSAIQLGSATVYSGTSTGTCPPARRETRRPGAPSRSPPSPSSSR